MNNMDRLMKEAEKEIRELNKGEEFTLKDLFKGYEWNRVPVKERVVLGTMFSEFAVQKHSHLEIVPGGGTGNVKYKKV